jgi:hypothetical protein
LLFGDHAAAALNIEKHLRTQQENYNFFFMNECKTTGSMKTFKQHDKDRESS